VHRKATPLETHTAATVMPIMMPAAMLHMVGTATPIMTHTAGMATPIRMNTTTDTGMDTGTDTGMDI